MYQSLKQSTKFAYRPYKMWTAVRDGLSILATLCKQKFGGPRPWSPRISASQSV